jgi:hypothetical protein
MTNRILKDGLPQRNDCVRQPVRIACRAAEMESVMGLSLSFNVSSRRPFQGRAPDNKAGEDCPRRLSLRNAFEQVYPHGG